MICPKCGSQNTSIQIIQKRKGHGLFGFLVRLFLILFSWILWLISLLIPSRRTKNYKLVICQNCGYSGKVSKFSKSANSIASSSPSSSKSHDYVADLHTVKNSEFWKNNVFIYIMLFLLAPLGIFLLYKYNKTLTDETKKTLSIVFSVIWLVMLVVASK